MTVIRKSSFQRFEFTQDIIYQCGNHKNSIMSVEQLIDILRDSFSIKYLQNFLKNLSIAEIV